jgi:hypothetical protein
MAELPLDKDPSDRYSELEQAYTEDRWSDVVRQGGALVQELEGPLGQQHGDLLSRAKLLIGHAHLYGLGKPQDALPHYRDVLAGQTDPELRRLAAAALEACESQADQAPGTVAQAGGADLEPAAGETVAGESFLAVVAAAQQRSSGGESRQPAASPWLAGKPHQEALVLNQPVLDRLTDPADPAPDASLEVEVVEEPELLEVAQADPSLAEEVELELSQIRLRRAAVREAGLPVNGASAPGAAQRNQGDGAAGRQPLDLTWEDPALVAALLRVELEV